MLLEHQAVPAESSPGAPALEAIALEVERIGESQRFLTQVLSDRRAHSDAPPKRQSGVTTPH